jgi:hypothetical protein
MFAAFNKKKTMKPKYEIDQTVYLTNGQPQTIYGVTKQSCGGFMYHVQECKHPRDEDELCPTPPADDLDKQIVNTQARLLKELVNGLPTYQIHEISNLIDLKIKKALLK